MKDIAHRFAAPQIFDTGRISTEIIPKREGSVGVVTVSGSVTNESLR